MLFGDDIGRSLVKAKETDRNTQSRLISGNKNDDSDFGRVKIVANRYMTALSIFTVQPDLWKLAVAVPTHKVDVAKTSSSTKGVVETVATLECRQEAGNGLLTLS